MLRHIFLKSRSYFFKCFTCYRATEGLCRKSPNCRKTNQSGSVSTGLCLHSVCVLSQMSVPNDVLVLEILQRTTWNKQHKVLSIFKRNLFQNSYGRPARFRSTHFARVLVECKSFPLAPHSSKQLQIFTGQHGEAPQGRAPHAQPWRLSGNGPHEWKIRKVGKHARASL